MFNEIQQPNAFDLGNFPLKVDYAGWALWQDYDFTGELANWIATSNWVGMDKYQPNGTVFGAIVHFSSFIGLDDSILAGVYCEGDSHAWFAYATGDPLG